MIIHWQTVAQFFVEGIPQGQPRPRARAIRANGRHVAQVYNPRTASGWKRAIALTAAQHRPAEPIEGPIRVDVELHMPRPQRLMRRRDPQGPVLCTARPDRDNADKAVLDALTDDGWWRDDAQVVGGEIWKMYHAKGGTAGAWIRIAVPAEEMIGCVR